jgi:hypothetical protein
MWREKKRVLRRGIIAVSLATLAPIIMLLLIQIPINEVMNIPPHAVLIASLLSIGIILLKGFRMIILSKIFDVNLGFSKAILIRSASEVLALISPGFTGDEVFRAYYLHKKGVDPGRSIWISYLDIFSDVSIASIIGMLGGIYLAFRNNYLFSTIIIIISLVILFLHIFIFNSMRRGKADLPRIIVRIIQIIAGKRYYERLINWVKRRISEVNQVSLNLPERLLIKNLLLSYFITILMAFMSGAALMSLFTSLNFQIGIINSTLSVHVYLVLTALPITIGGTGVTEVSLAIYSFTSAGSIPWLAIAGYRFSTYHIPLLFTALMMALLLGKYKINNY